MNNESYRVNTAPTRNGKPKGSYTVHVIGRCNTAERLDENWKRFQTRNELEAYGMANFLGACEKCWPNEVERDDENLKFAALFVE
jgi:hypothetical protein